MDAGTAVQKLRTGDLDFNQTSDGEADSLAESGSRLEGHSTKGRMIHAGTRNQKHVFPMSVSVSGARSRRSDSGLCQRILLRDGRRLVPDRQFSCGQRAPLYVSGTLGQIPPRREAGLYCPALRQSPDVPPRRSCGDGFQLRGESHLPFSVNRKNVLFSGHDEGAAAWGRISSLIETASFNGVELYAYLKETLEAIAAGHRRSNIAELLPWNSTN